MNPTSIPAVAMAGISLYVGFYHLLTFLRRREHHEDLTFALLSFATGLYAIFCAGLYSATSVDDGAIWQRAQLLALSAFVVAFLWFTFDYMHKKPTIIACAITIFYILAFVVQATDRSSLTLLAHYPSIKEVALPFGVMVRYFEVEFGPLTTVESIMGIVVALYIFWVGIRYYRQGHTREARPLLIAFSFMFVASLNDTAVSNGLYSFVYTIEYGYMAVTLVMTFSLSRTVVEAAMIKEALHKSEERYRSLVETTSDWVWETDINGVYTYASPKSRELLGYMPEELVGKTPFDLMLPEEAKRIKTEFEKIVASRKPIERLENTALHKDGRSVVLETSGVPVLGDDGRLLGYRGIDRDITYRKNAENEKGQLQEQLQQAMKMQAIGRLAGGIAHDFNNLLTAIIGNIDLARMSLDSPVSVVRCLEAIGAAAESAASLTRRLLAFSRRQIIEPRVLNINDLIRSLSDMLNRLLGEDVKLDIVPGRDLGNVLVDPGQFEQVFVNLAVNARDAMPGGGCLTIQTSNIDIGEEYCTRHRYIHPGRFVLLAVSDTGCGMSEEVKRHVFEPFFTTKPMGRGTGLGLATIFGIVKQSGGAIEVFSEEGKGTTFEIYFPLIEKKAEELSPSGPKSELPAGTETLLVVDDDNGVRVLAVKALKHLGYNVLSAPTASEVITFAEKYPDRIDLLITDVVMPGINGRELADRLCVLHPELKVLFTSGYTQNVIVHHGVVEENLNFLGKPYTVRALSAKVREVLDSGD